MISAHVIKDSVNSQGNRLTTFELRYPKFIHGEAKTHRLMNTGNEGGLEMLQEVGFMDDDNLSRNASSSRAIPTHKLLEEVRSSVLRAGPVEWGKNQPGMQAKELLVGHELASAQNLWAEAALAMADKAEAMLRVGVHKQIVNRLLEPFSHINVVCTATEYDNFFGLRLHADAQPEARVLAMHMWRAYQLSKPKELSAGEWHLPYVSEDDEEPMYCHMDGDVPAMKNGLIRISAARCARVTNKSFETGKVSTIKEDLGLYGKLVGAQPLHASPTEHQATPDHWDRRKVHEIRAITNTYAMDRWAGWNNPDEHGNFIGWRQYRKMIPGESRAPIPAEFAGQTGLLN